MNTSDIAHKIRLHVVNMTSTGKSSHVGSALSITDIMAVLYGKVLNVTPETTNNPERDRFILSKGHAGAAVYAALAETGFISTHTLKQHYQDGSILSGHVSHKGVPGVELSTGSLGHGLSVAAGICYGAKLDNNPLKSYVLLSDGECDEGSNWEAILFAAHHKLDNLVAIVDYNKIQSLASVCDTLNLEPFADKWEAFGWQVSQVDGHDHDALLSALKTHTADMPHCIIAHTIKGKGVSFMENEVLWHYRSPQGKEFTAAIEELEGQTNA